MPARKPVSLIPINETKDARSARIEAELKITPKGELTIHPPRALQGHKAASLLWKKYLSLYLSVEGKIVTSFDEDLLIQYCLLIEELPWLTEIRAGVEAEYKAIEKQITKGRKLKLTDEAYKNYLKLLEQYGALLARIQGIDARLDGKRKLVHSLSQSLYLTPRSRAGVAPPAKENQEEPVDEMAKLLAENWGN